MFENIKKILNKILSFNIGTLFKSEINNKFDTKIQDTKLVEYNRTENSNNIIQQNFHITVLPNFNFKEPIQSGIALGNENAKEVGYNINKLLVENNINKEQIKDNISNPEVLSTIAKANKIAYTTNDKENKQILSRLIYSKIITPDEEASKTLSQAINKMQDLTKNHLKIIAFLYLLESGFLTNSKTFTENYDKYIVNLINFPNKKLEDLGSTILGNGLAVTYSLGRSITAYIPRSFYDILTGKYTVGIDTRAKISKLDNAYKILGMAAAFLTPVGKCIGRTYSKDILGIDISDKNNTEEKKILTKDELEKEISNATKNTLRYEELD